jgi:predicted NAD-dependent protein-ADP-ribosyltransferase YbiA (DUF1768 family)
MGGPAIIDGKNYSEFDNFYRLDFEVNGIKYKSSEHYFQCQKTFDDEINNYTNEFNDIYEKSEGIGCWAAGGKIKKLRKNWNYIRVREMYDANNYKILSNKDILDLLIITKGKISFNQSTNFWNFWNSRILEKIRAENRKTENDLEYLEILNVLFNDFFDEKLGANYEGFDFKVDSKYFL